MLPLRTVHFSSLLGLYFESQDLTVLGCCSHGLTRLFCLFLNPHWPALPFFASRRAFLADCRAGLRFFRFFGSSPLWLPVLGVAFFPSESSQLIFLPSTSLPVICSLAAIILLSQSKLTKPNPLDSLVARSITTEASTTPWQLAKAAFSPSCQVVHARPPTNNLNAVALVPSVLLSFLATAA